MTETNLGVYKNPFRKRRERLSQISLQNRLVIAVMFVSAFVLLSVAGIIYRLVSTALIDQSTHTIARLDQELSTTVNLWLSLNIESLQALANLAEIRSLDGARQVPVLQAADKAFENVYLIHTIGADGFNLARSDGQPNTDYRDRSYVQAVMAGEPVVLEALIGRTSKQPALIIALPILDDRGRVGGVIASASDLDEISKSVQISRFGETGYAYVVDDSNRVLAHPDEAYTAELRDLSTYPPVIFMREAGNGFYEFQDDAGKEWRASVNTLENGWGVIIQQERAEFEAELSSVRRLFFLLIVLGLAVLFVLSSIAIRHSMRPIKTLIETTKAFAAGDLSRRVVIERKDETGELAESFNAMAAEITETLATLEQRVADRTRSLQASFQVSRRLVSIMDMHELVIEVVEEIKRIFDFYHVHIYLYNDTRSHLEMVGGTGEIGKQLLSNRHRIEKGIGLVSKSAETNQVVYVKDTNQEPSWLPNPLLTETKAEIVVPIAIGESVMGVLDVQQNVIQEILPDTIELLQAIANQTAVALHNTRLLNRAKQASNTETRVNSIGQRIQAATSIEFVLEIAVRELAEATGASRASIQVGLDLMGANKEFKTDKEHPNNGKGGNNMQRGPQE